MNGTRTASYVYAVTRPFDEDRLTGARGVGGAPVRLVVQDGLAAAVSAVPLDEFDEDALAERLEDRAWLEATARAHHAVVDAVARSAVAMPLRLSTLYRDDDRVRAVLRGNRERFGAVLTRLDGRVEWGVKVYADPDRAAARPTPDEPRAPAGVGAGRAYLNRRREQRHGREDAWRAAAELARRLDERLRELAEAGERHRPQDGRLSGASGENVLNAAYLVARGGDGERFLRAVREFGRDLAAGVRVELSGPWAPYSFAGGAAAGAPDPVGPGEPA
ncbi:GvpL/GvpF family gas vesicle protein [Actinorugispora endophytica]|uniref:Gas vesicle protein GvpL/GvpF n=1 Tax=Actinorugispora endophytica TaxID=1605990 RepID=A0A4R6V8B0_9ACTN|nr:GvpL/GvpF family gas vesicle protein [Actinorugispora endophytica]TDQ55379.1 gas vesicle protein GvpL/GvpF [Actinorugispora endophytica]